MKQKSSGEQCSPLLTFLNNSDHTVFKVYEVPYMMAVVTLLLALNCE